MRKTRVRTYSPYSRDAVSLLGGLIRSARLVKKMPIQEVADRAGVSRGLLQRIEKGDMKCEIGVVFEIAHLVGIPLFVPDHADLKRQLSYTNEKLALLPKSARARKSNIYDEF